MRERGRRWVGFLWRGPPGVSPPGSHARLRPRLRRQTRAGRDILAVSGGGTDRLVMMSPSQRTMRVRCDGRRDEGGRLAEMGADYRLLGGSP